MGALGKGVLHPRAHDDRGPSHQDHTPPIWAAASVPHHTPQWFLWASGIHRPAFPASGYHTGLVVHKVSSAQLCPAGFQGPMTGSPYSGYSAPHGPSVSAWHPHTEWSPGWQG